MPGSASESSSTPKNSACGWSRPRSATNGSSALRTSPWRGYMQDLLPAAGDPLELCRSGRAGRGTGSRARSRAVAARRRPPRAIARPPRTVRALRRSRRGGEQRRAASSRSRRPCSPRPGCGRAAGPLAAGSRPPSCPSSSSRSSPRSMRFLARGGFRALRSRAARCAAAPSRCARRATAAPSRQRAHGPRERELDLQLACHQECSPPDGCLASLPLPRNADARRPRVAPTS